MRRLISLPFLVVLFLACCMVFLPARSSAAACASLPNDKGQSAGTIAVAAPGKYTLWVRMWAPGASSDSVSVQVDDQCPVVVNDAESGSGFLWVNFRDAQPTQPVTYDLAAGSHAITLAGREAGAGVDRVLFASDPTCVPIGMGDNCLQGGSSTTKPTDKPHAIQQSKGWPYKPNWPVVTLCALVIVLAAIFIWRAYVSFKKSLTSVERQPGVIVGVGWYDSSTFFQRLKYFVRHHMLIVAAWAAVTLVAVAIGIVAATSSQSVFEAEAGKLSGGAMVISSTDAAGGKYVLFQSNAAAPGSGTSSAGNGATSGGSAKTGSGTKTGGGSSGGSQTGGGGGGGGGTTTSRSCGTAPKYPNTSCTGVPPGTAYAKTISGVYYAKTPGEVIDSWHIAGDLVIQATNITIKNSLIDGHVDNDSLPLVTSFTITDSTVGPASCDTEGWPSLNAHDMTATRVFLRNHQDGLDVVGDNVTMTDSLVQPCYQPPEVVGSDGFHTDGVQDQCSTTCSNLTLTHNTFDSRAFYGGHSMGNSALNLGSVADGSHLRAVTLNSNQFLGGGYSTDLTWSAGAVWTIINNAWVEGTWAYAPTDSEGTCSHQSWSGNTIITIDASYAANATVSALGCAN